MKRVLTTITSMLILGGVLNNSSLAQVSVVNLETGNDVQFIDVYWNANRDIADLNIGCQQFSFSDGAGVYEEVLGINEFTHAALPLTEPFIARLEATIDIVSPFRDPSVWTVVDGAYFGPMPVNGLIESIQKNGQEAIRVWGFDGSSSRYTECYDQSGRSLSPTGSADEILPDPIELVTPTVIVQGSPNPALNGVLINRETGTEVVLQTARWNLYSNFIGRSIRCDRQVWDGTQYNFGLYAEDFTFFPIETVNSDSGYLYQSSAFSGAGINNMVDHDWVVQNGEIQIELFGDISVLGDFFISEQVEIIPADVDAPPESLTSRGFVRSWVSNDEYYRCSDNGAVVGIAPSGFAAVLDGAPRDLIPIGSLVEPEQPIVVDPGTPEPDSTVNGEGSDDIAPLVVTENCDYTDADDFDGYGFDPVTMMSCPPLANNNSVDDTTDTGSNVQDVGGADVVQINPAPVDNASDDLDDNTTVQNTNDVQSNPDTANNSSDDSTGNSNNATTAENENTDVEDEVVASNTQIDTTGSDLDSSAESSSESGGGSFWLPLLIFVLAFRHPLRAIQKQ